MAHLKRIWRTLLFFAATLALPASAQDGHGAKAPAGFAAEMHAGMNRMMAGMEAAPMTGDPDVDFLAMMIPHHEGAVEMARLLLIHGKDPLVRRLAEEIIASQQTEIAAMRERLNVLRARPDVNPGGFPALGGTRGPVPAGK